MVPKLTDELFGPGADIFDAAEPVTADILALDRLAIAAWPAPVQHHQNGWAYRFANGISRRANSVAPLPVSQDFDLEENIQHVETFYLERNLQPRFQLSPAASPDGLDQVLAKRGYEIETPVSIQITSADHVARASAISDNIRLDTSPLDGWWACYEKGHARDAEAIISNARDRALFASWHDSTDKIQGIGLGVVGGNWLGVFAMWTHPDHRRKGIGSEIIAALAKSMVDRGGLGVYLQVEESNETAKRLYEKIGFRTLYGYHYRTLWTKL